MKRPSTAFTIVVSGSLVVLAWIAMGAADDNRGGRSPSAAGGPEVQVRWASGRALVITHPAGARVFTHQDAVAGVAVAYEQVTAR